MRTKRTNEKEAARQCEKAAAWLELVEAEEQLILDLRDWKPRVYTDQEKF